MRDAGNDVLAFATADALRKTLLAKGFEVRDRKDGGFDLKRVNPSPTAT